MAGELYPFHQTGKRKEGDKTETKLKPKWISIHSRAKEDTI